MAAAMISARKQWCRGVQICILSAFMSLVELYVGKLKARLKRMRLDVLTLVVQHLVGEVPIP